jgi:thiamine pyrophosphate-dependent acetolactate synthase large subunit-like protein
MFYKKRFSHSAIRPPDFAKVAEGFGAKGVTISKAEDMMPYTKEEIAALKEKVRAKLVDSRLRHTAERVPPPPTSARTPSRK